ncbi:hypothetical protein PAMA_008212 [Pampus argenteus]
MEPVGILTTLNRNSWYKSYVSLIKDDTNKESLSAIERSIFVVCLDGPMPKVSDEMYTNNAACQILHGGGSQSNSGNRWFDKPMQFIIGEDGEFGGNFSHSLADGTVLGVFCDNVLAYMKKPEMMQTSMGSLSLPKKLHFNVTPEIKRDIEEAKQSMDLLAQDVDLKVLVFDHFGKNVLKAHRISPDAFVQMAIQLAYYRVHHYFGAVQESTSLRMFRYGRIASVSAHSSAAFAFVKAFDDPGKQNTEKIDLLEKAMKVHTSSVHRAINGQSFVDHIFGLKIQADLEKIPIPDIFFKILHFNVYASQVTTKMGNLPVGCTNTDAYVSVYSVMSDYITLAISAFNTCKETDVVQLIQAIKDALLDMRTMLLQSPRV